MKRQLRNRITAMLGVIISPIAAALDHKLSIHLLITTILYIVVPIFGGSIYFFWSIGVDLGWTFITLFLPFITVY